MWADAIGQIFFSIGVCMGVMTSYGSYNKIKKPIIMDSFIISISNSVVSFISGFAVWSIVGYLATTTGREVPNISLGLVFVTYPEAIDTIAQPNFWGILLSLTLFLLGLDSAFAMIEAVSTVIYDGMPVDSRPHRACITFVLCVFGFGFSCLFCTNWGMTLFDVFDHYLSNYLLFIVGILQCLGVGWLFDIERTAAMGAKYWQSVQISTYGYWVLLFVCGVAGTADYNAKYAMLAFITVECMVILPWSFIVCDTTFDDWWSNVCMCGVKRIGYSMSKLARLDTKNPLEMLWWEPFFVFYFAFCTKFLIPFALWFCLLFSIQKDINVPYESYTWHWQLAGLAVPVIGLVVFAMFTCCCLEPVDLDEVEFAEDLSPDEIMAYKREKYANKWRKLHLGSAVSKLASLANTNSENQPLNEANSKVAPEPSKSIELAKVEDKEEKEVEEEN